MLRLWNYYLIVALFGLFICLFVMYLWVVFRCAFDLCVLLLFAGRSYLRLFVVVGYVAMLWAVEYVVLLVVIAVNLGVCD